MAEKAKAKKAKPLAKKTAAARPKKKEISVKDAYHETDAEDLQLAQEELPKRGSKTTKVASEKKVQIAAERSKPEPKAIVAEEKPVKAVTAPQIIAPRVVIEKPAIEAKVEMPKHEAPRQEPKPHAQPAQGQRDGLNIRLSESLVKKLKEQAADEGISLEEFISELLAESVVLRAWEIVERKNAMKGGHNQGPGMQGGGRNFNNQGQSNKSNNNNQRSGNNPQGGGGKGQRMNQQRYQSIMDDKATFLEYVRSQEKTRR